MDKKTTYFGKYSNVTLIFLVFCGLAFVLILSYLTHRGNTFDRLETEFEAQQVSGHIVGLRDLTRGSVLIDIDDALTNRTLQYNLRIMDYVRIYGIAVGDSIIKEINSDTLIVRKNGVDVKFSF